MHWLWVGLTSRCEMKGAGPGRGRWDPRTHRLLSRKLVSDITLSERNRIDSVWLKPAGFLGVVYQPQRLGVQLGKTGGWVGEWGPVGAQSWLWEDCCVISVPCILFLRLNHWRVTSLPGALDGDGCIGTVAANPRWLTSYYLPMCFTLSNFAVFQVHDPHRPFS
jgi:hypothetical protein